MKCKFCMKELKNGKEYCNKICKKAYKEYGTIKNRYNRDKTIQKRKTIDLRAKLFGKRYANCTFFNFKCANTYQKEVKEKVTKIATSIKSGISIIAAFIGPWGTGKDHLCAAMVLYTGFRKVKHKTIMQISRMIREGENQQKQIDSLTDNSILFINEIGLQSCTDFEKNILHEIVDTILRNMKSCILLSNEKEKRFQECIDYPGKNRVWDRIDKVIIFQGESYRSVQRGG